MASNSCVFIAPGETRQLRLTGRAAWLANLLIQSGPRRLTAADLPPGVRISAVIHTLRRAGVPISGATEPHGGRFPGWHRRYALACDLREEGVQ